MSDFVFQSRILLLFSSFLFVHQRHIFHYKELWELLRSGTIRRHQLEAKGLLTPMIHRLLRISCSRNPETPQIRSFFYEKWLLFGVLRVKKSCFFMQAWNAWPFDPSIINIWRKAVQKTVPENGAGSAQLFFSLRRVFLKCANELEIA